MTIDPANASAPNIVERAKNILMQPKAEWDRIAGEPADVNKLYVGYLVPLMVVALVAGLIGSAVIGNSMFGVTVRTPIVGGLVMAVLQLIAGVGIAFIMATVTNALAPNFGSVQDQGQAHKLIVYSLTAVMAASIILILPMLAILVLLGLIYSMVLCWMGLPKLMKTPEDKRVGYFATIVVIWFVVAFVVNMVVGSIAMATGLVRMPGAPTYSFGQNESAPVQGEVTLPGGGTLDMEALQRQASAAQGGGAVIVEPARVQAQLPPSLPGGFTLASSSSSSAMGMSQAEGVYRHGDAELRVSVVQTGAMGAIANMAAGMNVQENRQDGDGYARTQTIDGRIYNEEVTGNGRNASYGVVGRGVAVSAEGTNVTLDQARAAVETIGVQRLEREFGA
jgi:hypothetical protein